MKRLCLLLVLLFVTTAEAGKSYSSSKSSSSSSSSSKSFSSSKSSSSSSSSSKSFSSSKSSSSSSSSSKSFSSSKSSTPSAGKSYSSSSSKSYSSPSTSTSTSSTSIKPATKTSFDSLGSKEQMKVESRQSYNKGQSTKTEYKTSSGSTAKIDPKDKKIDQLRNQLDREKWVNRDLRQQQFYGTYYSRPLVVYNDPYPSFFWWWLLDRSLDERAMWAYHHRHDMDQARYQALLAKDSQLEAKIKMLEAQKIERNTAYVPNGMDNDLMYSNEYVDAVYNPEQGEDSGVGLKVLLWIFVILFIIALVYFAFFYRGF
jgi:hypothetical protein